MPGLSSPGRIHDSIRSAGSGSLVNGLKAARARAPIRNGAESIVIPPGSAATLRHRLEDPRREVLVGVAVGQDEAADPLRVAGDQHLRHRAARVVADDRDVAEVERIEKAGDQVRDPVRAEVGLGPHRDLLGADRPVGREAAVGRREAVDDAVPEPAVDEEAVDEDHRAPLARLAVPDPPGGQIDLVALIGIGHGPNLLDEMALPVGD